MANVLPTQDRVALQRNYRLRLAVTVLFTASAVMTIGIVSMVPAYLLATARLSEVARYRDIQEQTRDIAKTDTAVKTARVVTTQVAELLKTRRVGATAAMQYVLDDWKAYADDIIIGSMDYQINRIQGTEVSQLRISGEARNRTSLDTFVQALRADKTFSDVSFPVSNLAGGELVNFSITLQFES